jgi:hypothetical protein
MELQKKLQRRIIATIARLCPTNGSSSHHQHILPTVIPTRTGRGLIPSSVRERVGLRSGGISLPIPRLFPPTNGYKQSSPTSN